MPRKRGTCLAGGPHIPILLQSSSRTGSGGQTILKDMRWTSYRSLGNLERGSVRNDQIRVAFVVNQIKRYLLNEILMQVHRSLEIIFDLAQLRRIQFVNSLGQLRTIGKRVPLRFFG